MIKKCSNVKNNLDLEKIQTIGQIFPDIYETAPKEMRSPTKFLAFIENYFLIINKKRNIVKNRLKCLKV